MKYIPLLLVAICTTVFADQGLQLNELQRLPHDAIPVVTVPSLDYATLFAEDRSRERTGQAPRFALPNQTAITPGTNGLWERIDLNTLRWTLRVACDNAVSMNFGFGHYNMPPSGSMTISDISGNFRIRPFTADDNKLHGQLWTPVVPGTEALIEIVVDSNEKAFVVKGIQLTSINSGYRWLRDATERGSSESCNIDVMCPQGNPWWDEIPSVGVYTLNGYLTCTGVMLNNTSQDQTPYFLTANHCGITNGSDSSVVVYWNHQNSYCRTPGSGDSGGNGNGNFSQFTSGSTMRASRSYSDFTLTELSSNPNSAWGVTYSGWSRASSASLGAGIHHPEAAEKRISFPDAVNASGEYWDVNWDAGRTAPGSSGSPLYDGNHRVVGQLCCGSSYCWNDYNDYYGRSLNLSWSGNNSSSLSNWLDPVNSNVQTLDTLVPGGGGDPQGACCVGTSCTYVTAAACASSGGTYQGDSVSCTSNPCGGGGGDCEAGWTEDCQGTCFPDYVYEAWIGDGFCDDGAYIPADYNCSECPAGVPIWLNCDAFNCDGGDCECGGGDPTGACCIGSSCSVMTSASCSSAGGSYLGDNSSCSGDPCGGGGGCPAGEIEDCNGNCCPDFWVGDGYCDDGTYSWNGVPIYLNCNEFNCDGGDCTDCGGGGCPAGEIEDCNGNCCPDYWVGDGYCDDGAYTWNGIPIYLNCDAFNCDGGDCECGGGDPTGACCVGESCSTGTEADCNAAGGSYLGDNSSCSGNPCSGGGNCEAGWTEDCQGTCFPDYIYEAWIGDTFCDDGSYIPADYGCSECPSGVAIWLDCDEFNCDGGDCECDPVDPTGTCCFDSDCLVMAEVDCTNAGGEWGGPDTACDADTCGTPCSGDVDGSGTVDVTDILAIVAAWGTNDPDADINGDGIVNVSDMLEAIAGWGPC